MSDENKYGYYAVSWEPPTGTDEIEYNTAELLAAMELFGAECVAHLQANDPIPVAYVKLKRADITKAHDFLHEFIGEDKAERLGFYLCECNVEEYFRRH